MIKETLHLEIRNVYGRELVYPACDISRALVLLTRRKTFDEGDLKTLKLMGFEVILKPSL